MSFGILNFFNSIHTLRRFAKILTFSCKLYALRFVPNGFIDKISFPKIKFYNKFCEPREFWNNSIYRLNQILNSLIFLCKYLTFVALKCFKNKLDQFAKNLNLQASYFSSEVLKLTNSIHILDPFAKQFQLWWFSIFPSCFIDEIGARFFSSKLLKHKKLKKSNFFPTESARKITSLFSKLFTLWNFQMFHFIF